MARHDTSIERSGQGVIGVCSCRARQMKPVPTKQGAEDWAHQHLTVAARAQASLENKLTNAKYLEYLWDCANDPQRSKQERKIWEQLAKEFEPRVKAKKVTFDTGVETQPLF